MWLHRVPVKRQDRHSVGLTDATGNEVVVSVRLEDDPDDGPTMILRFHDPDRHFRFIPRVWKGQRNAAPPPNEGAEAR